MPGLRKTRAASRRRARLSDDALLDLVQRRSFAFFWEAAHPASGLARDRTGTREDVAGDLVATGGSGFGVMAIIVAVERGWVSRDDALIRLHAMLACLEKATCYHGMFPHFMNGSTGATVPFTRKDDAADIMETALLLQGLLAARAYFDRAAESETRLRARISRLWQEAEWNWHTPEGRLVLLWHWSPNNGWSLNHEVRGWNECLIAYLLAAASPTYPIEPEVYHRGWAAGPAMVNQRTYYDIALPLGPAYGGPLFFAHYSFCCLDPRGLRDRYADYFAQNTRHTLINYEHCVRNPLGHKGYGPDCWGLTASDEPGGYSAHAPANDNGVIAPTAALSSFSYAPEQAMAALRHFHDDLGDRIWGRFGFCDAFSLDRDWYAEAYLAVDQGPIVAMIENYRTGLLWDLFMGIPEIRAGLVRLGFQTPHLA
jgi:hypothetical protein